MSDSQGATTNAADQARAAALKARGEEAVGSAGAGALAVFPPVEVASGTYKYVLITASNPSTDEQKVLLRSGVGSYHVDVASPTVDALKSAGMKATIPGGGRITRDDSKKEISIFGFSYGFGKGDHALAAEMCRIEFPGYKVSWSDEGY
jgi:hypothetical protein